MKIRVDESLGNRKPQFNVCGTSVQKLLTSTNTETSTGSTVRPKIGILVISYNASTLLAQTIARIPSSLYPLIEEIFIFDDKSKDDTFEVARQIKQDSLWKDKLSIFCNSTNLGYGGNQKVGYRYAIERGLDYVVMLHGDGQYAPEFLPELLLPIFEKKADVVFGSRMVNKSAALKGGMPFYKWLGNQVLTTFENFILGTKLSEFHSGYRLYSTRLLKAIPFEENTDVFHFDTQIIIQCRALAVSIHEVPIETFYGDEVCNVNGMKYAFDVCLSVLEYRLHQLHIIRRGRYLVRHDSHYTRKNSPYSSHEQILSLIPETTKGATKETTKDPKKALDLGSSHGLLSTSLLSKGVTSICVDCVPEEQVHLPCGAYVEADLERAEELNFSCRFDYIILADIIEHLRNAKELLRVTKKFIKEDGRVIISVPNIAIWFYRLSLLLGRFNYGPKGTLDETHVRFYTLSTLKQLLDQTGLRVITIRPTGLPFEVVFESSGKTPFIRWIDSFYYLLAKWMPTLFAYQFVVEAEFISPTKTL